MLFQVIQFQKSWQIIHQINILIPLSNREDEGRVISWNNAFTAFDIPVEILKSDDIAQGIKKYNISIQS